MTTVRLLLAVLLAAPPLAATLSTPRAVTAGAPWQATLTVHRGAKPFTGAAPALTFRNGLTRRTVTAARTARKGTYSARVTLPFTGTWKAEARAGGKRITLRSVSVGAAAPVPSILPTADAFPICGGERDFLPQYATALDGDSVWVACRRSAEFGRVEAATGGLRALLPAGSQPPQSIAAGGGAIWSVSRGPWLTRLDTATGQVTTIGLGGESSYVWFAAGYVWAADDTRSRLIRIDPATRHTVAEMQVGDGTAAFVSDGTHAWALNHRDATLDRIDLATSAVTRLGRLPGEAPERMALFAGSLWITGRGTDLLRVDPATGAVQATVEIGAGGVDVAAAGGRIWVAAANAGDDRSGLPVLEHLYAVDPATTTIAETLAPTGRLVVDGVATDGTTLWIADVVGGRLYRLRRG
jgi:streptogramin lyase